MQHPRPPATDTATAPDDGFFIPDLCAPQAVFLAVLLAELVVLLHVLASGPLAEFDWRLLGAGSIFVQWNALLCIAVICRLRKSLLDLTPAAATAVCLGVVLALSTLSSVLVFRFYPLLGPQSGGLADWALRNALLALILAAIVLRYAYLQQRVALQQRSELQLRLDALRARIRPHFLFNTLNSIASLIAVQPERAEQAIEDVAELFRAALSTGDRDSSLGEECRLCELYLEIEQLRLGDRLSVEWEIDESLRDTTLPALLLQPLVENAVYHGISQLPKGGAVRIRAWREASALCVEVQNPVSERVVSRPGGNRMALDNIRQRLDAQYGAAASLWVGAERNSYRARISIPLAQAPAQ
ncbi:sensor histidine kinase [Congregibacter variabilis]|uniref:Sensor histidine kinase n=1 Tax=Congregibacter variabilis TaxID=3081200 RepID=A0ABZ0HYP3_9GAMM|nr:sensor histidine kinase [Congregibacter sp. IMCC43200]